MDDTISRQAAIDALMPIYKSASLRNRNVFSTVKKCMATIEELPSAQTERKKGEWILKPNIYGVAYCSECDYELHTDNTNYCPNCGADMRGEQG